MGVTEISAGVQLAFPLDPRVDALGDGERAAVEGCIAFEDEHQADGATPAPTCRCRRPWPTDDRERCCKCGRNLQPQPRLAPQKGH
jgi:hypothetical protein